MQIATSLSNEIARYLDLDTRQLQLTATNMANIDTPGYQAVGMDFEGEMRRSLAGESGDLDVAGGVGGVRVTLEDGLVVRPDGNNVSMDREGLEMAQAQLKFKTGVALLKREYSRIFDAIHAEAK